MSVYVGRGTEFPSTLNSAYNWGKWSIFCVFGLEIGEKSGATNRKVAGSMPAGAIGIFY